MSYEDLLIEDARLVLLRVMYEMPNRRANSSVLCSILDEKFCHALELADVKRELRWLEEQQLVKIDDVSNGAVLVAKLTERGADVAAGRARVDGVKRPGA